MLLGPGPKTLQVQSVESTVRIPSDDVQRLVPGVVKLRIETIDETGLQQAIDDGGDVSLGDIDPDQAARVVGSSALLGQQSEVAVIASLELVDGKIRIVPRDIQRRRRRRAAVAVRGAAGPAAAVHAAASTPARCRWTSPRPRSGPAR